MSDIGTIRIRSPYGVESIERLEFSVRPGEHGRLRLAGICSDSAGFDPLYKSSGDDVVEVFELAEGGKRQTLFYGFAREVSFSRRHGVYSFELEAMTGTVALDEKKESRSFQDTDLTYDAIIPAVIGRMDSLIHKGDGEAIKVPAIQYEETDWEFIKRLASRLNTAPVPDLVTPNLHFGLPAGRERKPPKNLPWSSGKDTAGYLRAIAAGADVSDADFCYFRIVCGERFEIGDKVTFMGKPLRVVGLTARLDRGDLRYTYTLATENNLYRPRLPATIAGKSLEGEIIAIRGEQVRLHLDMDEKQDEYSAYWYLFAPITGSLMYAMPILGSKARLYFPEGFEESGFVQDCVRVNGDVCANTAAPDTRYFRTEHGAELMMAPGRLHFKDMGVATRGALSLEFDDSFGIKIRSHMGLRMGASGSISLSAGGQVGFSAPGNVAFNQVPVSNGKSAGGQPESSFSYENDTNMSAIGVNYRGLSRIRYMPYPNPLVSVANPGTIQAPAALLGNDSSQTQGNEFNWKGLLAGIAVVAIAAVGAVVSAVATVAALSPMSPASAATLGKDMILSVALVGAAIGAACAVVQAAVADSGQTGTGTYLNAAIEGGLVGAVVGATFFPTAISTFFRRKGGKKEKKLPLTIDALHMTEGEKKTFGWGNMVGMVKADKAERMLRIGIDISKVISGVIDYNDNHIGKNYDNNDWLEAEWSASMLSDYINGQWNRPNREFQMGNYTADRNGCGWIATYNALVALGIEDKRPADIIEYYDKNGGTFLNGALGINSKSIADYFRSRNLKTTFESLPLPGVADERIKSSTVCVLEYTDLAEFMHYVTIEYKATDGKFHIYNETGDGETEEIYSSINDWADGSERKSWAGFAPYTILALITLEEE